MKSEFHKGISSVAMVMDVVPGKKNSILKAKGLEQCSHIKWPCLLSDNKLSEMNIT